MTVRDHMILQLAAAQYRYPGRRESDAFDQVGLRATSFWAAVGHLLERPDALAAYPVEVGRLRRLRDRRARARTGARDVCTRAHKGA